MPVSFSGSAAGAPADGLIQDEPSASCWQTSRVKEITTSAVKRWKAALLIPSAPSCPSLILFSLIDCAAHTNYSISSSCSHFTSLNLLPPPRHHYLLFLLSLLLPAFFLLHPLSSGTRCPTTHNSVLVQRIFWSRDHESAGPELGAY